VEDTKVVLFIDSMDDLLELVNDRTIDATSLDFISDNIARTTHKHKSKEMRTKAKDQNKSKEMR
jgi:hypothetical protein